MYGDLSVVCLQKMIWYYGNNYRLNFNIYLSCSLMIKILRCTVLVGDQEVLSELKKSMQN